MKFEIENSNKDVLVIDVPEEGGQPTFTVRPFVYQPSKAEIEASLIAEGERQKEERFHELARTVRMRPGPQGVTQILTADGQWVGFNFAEPWTDESLVIASRLFWGDYQPGVLDREDVNGPDVQLVIQERV